MGRGDPRSSVLSSPSFLRSFWTPVRDPLCCSPPPSMSQSHSMIPAIFHQAALIALADVTGPLCGCFCAFHIWSKMFTRVQSVDEAGGGEQKKSNFVWKHFQSLISKEGGWKGGWTGGVLFCQESSKTRECTLLVCCRMKNEKFNSTWIPKNKWAVEVGSESCTHTYSEICIGKK